MNSPTAAIFAGGRSERMGRDKAGIVYQGETLLARTVRIAQKTGCAVIVVGRERPDDWLLPGVKFIPDASPGQGPLGGLTTALTEADGSPVLALACDMPLLTPDALRWLLGDAERLLSERGGDGLITSNGTQWEPLFSVYAPSSLPLAIRHLNEGRRSLHALIAAGHFQFFPCPPEVAAALVNVNTPGELQELYATAPSADTGRRP